jgi:hypothetical protein
MSTQRFVAWVAPIAAKYRASQAEAVQIARSVSDAELSRSTSDDGWTVRDELVHIEASTADFVETLGTLLRGDAVDMSVFADIDGRNARNLTARKDRPMADIVNDLASVSSALAELLAQLTDEDELRQPAGMPFPLGQMMEGYAMHDPYHIGQIRGAIE